MLMSAQKTESPITFRGSSEDKEIISALANRFNVSPSVAIRIGLQVAYALFTSPIIRNFFLMQNVNIENREDKKYSKSAKRKQKAESKDQIGLWPAKVEK